MAEHLEIAQGSKTEKYSTLYKQIVALTESEPDTIARMANVAAMIHATFDFCGPVFIESKTICWYSRHSKGLSLAHALHMDEVYAERRGKRQQQLLFAMSKSSPDTLLVAAHRKARL